MTLDTAVDKSRKMADSVTRSPARLCSRDGKLYYCGCLEYDALLPTGTYLVFFLIPACFSSSCCFVCVAIICSSPASTCSCVFRIMPHVGIPFVLQYVRICLVFSVVLISWLACLLCSRTRYVGFPYTVTVVYPF